MTPKETAEALVDDLADAAVQCYISSGHVLDGKRLIGARANLLAAITGPAERIEKALAICDDIERTDPAMRYAVSGVVLWLRTALSGPTEVSKTFTPGGEQT